MQTTSSPSLHRLSGIMLSVVYEQQVLLFTVADASLHLSLVTQGLELCDAVIGSCASFSSDNVSVGGGVQTLIFESPLGFCFHGDVVVDCFALPASIPLLLSSSSWTRSQLLYNGLISLFRGLQSDQNQTLESVGLSKWSVNARRSTNAMELIHWKKLMPLCSPMPGTGA